MENRMYLTETEAKAKGLPSVQEQIDRYNAALPNRTPQEAAIMLRLAKEGVHPSDIDRRTAEVMALPTTAYVLRALDSEGKQFFYTGKAGRTQD